MELILFAIAAAIFSFAPVDKAVPVACLVSYNGECLYTDTAHDPISLTGTYVCR